MPVTLPQYLVLTGEPIPIVGLCRQRAKRPTEDTLQGKKFTEELLHGNQEKGCKEEKETLTVRETSPRMGHVISLKACQEKHLLGGFLISIVSRQPSYQEAPRK